MVLHLHHECGALVKDHKPKHEWERERMTPRCQYSIQIPVAIFLAIVWGGVHDLNLGLVEVNVRSRTSCPGA
jgi:hypothetical protein